ncbi:hypothetical protein M9Q43_13255 [Flavobacterium sp. HXWNR29]|uniref:hypothetical protein n=1 Tax=Flavobacterium odoriferum TaxID=2946604 RepID=UPI0021CB78E5|nr:hypothetical protein [Flavobacterium sp. HXWNR29]MCU4190124.1 hypothetical protein [Flavobacterium sp. HXWNR29]
MEQDFVGIVLYDIQLNGHLNGVYANNQSPTLNRILTETARFINSVTDTSGRIINRYDVFYFDGENDHRGELRLVFNEDRTIRAFWIVNNEEWFNGLGFQMNDRQIAIYYNPSN